MSTMTLTAEQKTEFRRACVEDGVKPRETCPLCRETVEHVAPLYDINSPSPDWAERPVSDEYRCPGCGIGYRVRRSTAPEDAAR